MIQISLYQLAAAMVNQLPSHHAPGISLSVFYRGQITLHTMDTLADDDGNMTGPFVQYRNLDRLAIFCINNGYCFVFHN